MSIFTRAIDLALALTGNATTKDVLATNTPPQFDATKLLATAEFVQRALGNFSDAAHLVTNGATLTAAQAGKYLAIKAGTVTLTLPDTEDVPLGATYYLHNVSTDGADCVVNRKGDDLISDEGGSKTSITVKGGTHVAFVKTLDDLWYATGTGVIGSSYAMKKDFSAKGFQRLPSGLILNWGLEAGIATASNAVVNFATGGNFPTAALAGFTAYSNQSGNPAAGVTPIGQVRGLGTSSITIRNLYSGAADYYWLAIGY